MLDRVEVAEGVGQLRGQGRDAPHFLIEGPELLVEGHPLELLQPALQPRLAVFIEEKLRIRQARRQHPLISGRDRRLAASHVDHGHKVGQQAPVLAQQGEVALMLLHRRHEHVLRQVEVFGIEGSDDNLRHLHRKDGLLQEGLVAMQHAALLLGDPLDLRDDHRPPPIRIHDHASVLQGFLIRSEVLDSQGTAGREDAMTESLVPCLEACELKPDCRAAVEDQKPAHRARKPDVCFVPPHRLRKRKTADQLGEKSR